MPGAATVKSMQLIRLNSVIFNKDLNLLALKKHQIYSGSLVPIFNTFSPSTSDFFK